MTPAAAIAALVLALAPAAPAEVEAPTSISSTSNTAAHPERRAGADGPESRETSTSTPTPTPAEPDLDDAGPVPARAYLVERVAFTGLDHVREWAARRHLVVQEGQTLDEQRVLVSRLRLLQLGWFSRVETRVEKGTVRGQVVVVFEVTERNTLIVSDLALGSTETAPVFGGLGLSQQNFLGQGLALGGAFVWGGAPAGRRDEPDRFALRGAFFAPDIGVLGQRFTGGASALWIRGEELICPDPECGVYQGRLSAAPRLRVQRVGGELTFGVRPGPFERVTLGWRGEWIDAKTVSGAGLAGPPSHSTLSALVATWEYDSRDDLFLPRSGLFTLAQVTFGSALLGSDHEYSRYVLQAETGFGLLGQPLRFQGFLGALQGGAPSFERFYPADLAYFAIGPAQGRSLELNFTSDTRYDAFAAMGGLEYAVALWSHGRFFQRGYLALGARAVWSAAVPGGGRTAFSRWPLSLDVALRLDTPIGTFNASLAAALDNPL
jgi:outer membrane protein assembly factor BamA